MVDMDQFNDCVCVRPWSANILQISPRKVAPNREIWSVILETFRVQRGQWLQPGTEYNVTCGFGFCSWLAVKRIAFIIINAQDLKFLRQWFFYYLIHVGSVCWCAEDSLVLQLHLFVLSRLFALLISRKVSFWSCVYHVFSLFEINRSVMLIVLKLVTREIL